MKKIVFFILIVIIGFQVQSQAQNNLSKNTLYAGVGFVGLGGSITATYERVFYETNKNKKQFIHSIATRVGGGYWANWGNAGPNLNIGTTLLTGKNKHHLEILPILAFLYDHTSYKIRVSNAEYFNEPRPSRLDSCYLVGGASVGYRYQKPEGGFLFRIGLGYPEGLYLGLGASF